jgi:SAM-dependent methyltransferase
MSPYFRDYFIFSGQLVNGVRMEHERRIAQERQRDTAPFLEGDRPRQILDLANGRLRPQYSLLKADAQEVYGIDRVNKAPSGWVDRGYQVARWLYARRLRSPRSSSRGPTLVGGDVAFLPFKDHSFDLVTSVAAFEHFHHVPAVVADLHRVLRRGGIAYIRIHLFTCPSGAHNLPSMEIPLRTLPRGVEAWDHLRKRRLPISVPLNEWRRQQYLAVFEQRFEVLKSYCAMREGEEMLTPEIKAELSHYQVDELTCGSYVIVARKA